MISFSLNEREYRFTGDPQTPLLWVLRDDAGLTGFMTRTCDSADTWGDPSRAACT